MPTLQMDGTAIAGHALTLIALAKLSPGTVRPSPTAGEADARPLIVEFRIG